MKLLYIQTIVPAYREHVINELNSNFDLYLIANNSNEEDGYKTSQVKIKNTIDEKTKKIFFGLLTYQSNTIKNIRKINPDIILSHSDIKNISCWLAMIYAKINSIPYYSYGHGPYKKTKYLILYKIIYKIILKLHSGYIAYNEYSKLSFGKLSIKSDKLHYINNTIKLYGNTSIEEKTGAENGILFLGRLRKNSGLNTLIDACEDVRKNGVDINLHIIGTGEEHDFLKSYAENKSWVKIYGKIFDHGKISEISKNCRIGCYPGSAGLSVVHYFALGLPPLVKKSMETHMGPEPAYVLDKINGFHFHGNEDLSSKLLNIFLLPAENYKKISHGSLETYKKLSIDNFAKSLQKIHEKNK